MPTIAPDDVGPAAGVAQDEAGEAGGEQRERDQGQDRVVGEAGRQQAAVGGVEPVEDAARRRRHAASR